MTLDDFPEVYAAALRSQRWELVAPLIHDDACVTFSTGALHRGKAEVRRAFEANFAAIKNDDFRVFDLQWQSREPDRAEYAFRFAWSGHLNGQPVSGGGTGMATLVRTPAGWQLLGETLRRLSP